MFCCCCLGGDLSRRDRKDVGDKLTGAAHVASVDVPRDRKAWFRVRFFAFLRGEMRGARSARSDAIDERKKKKRN